MRTASPLLLSPQKAADYIGIARTSLRTLAKAERIEYVRLNGRRMFTTSSLEKFVAELARKDDDGPKRKTRRH